MTDVATDDLDRFFHTYREAYAALDLDAVCDHYAVPLLSVMPDGPVWMRTAADLESVMGAYLETLRDGDYDHGEIDELVYHRLADEAVVASSAWTRYTSAGTVFERLGTTYLLHREGTDWRILALVVHEPTTVIQ